MKAEGTRQGERPIRPRPGWLLVLCSILVPLFSVAPSGSAGEPAAYRSRFRIGVGFVRELQADRAETHFALGLATIWNVRPRIGIGVDGALHDLRDDPVSGSFGLARLTASVEIRRTPFGPLLPFAAAGAGVYSWRWCENGSGTEIGFCSLANPDRKKNSIGAWVGAGFHAGMARKRSFSFALQIHPYSTFEGGRRFAQVLLAFGF
jgi:hypothetical protein